MTTSFFGQQQAVPNLQQQQPAQFTQPTFATSQPQQQQHQQQAIRSIQDIYQNAAILTSAVSGPELFGDDRDETISHLNQLLAAVGVGHGYYRLPNFAYQFSPQNIFYRLKGVGYNRLSKHKNADGMVSLVLNQEPSKFEATADKIKLMDALSAILRVVKQPAAGQLMLGSMQAQQAAARPNLHVEIKSIIPLDEQQTEVVIVAKEYGGAPGRGIFTASNLFNELRQREADLRQLGVVKIVPRMEVDKPELEAYLRRPPPGFEEIWAQAIRENPDPERLIPYPIQGFPQLLQRKKQQITLVGSLHVNLDDYVNRLVLVQNELLTARSRYAKILQTQKQFSNRLIHALATQTQNQRHGQIVDEKEEQLQCRLEGINVLLNGPDKLKEQVAAIYSTLRKDSEKLRQNMREKSAKLGLNISQQDMSEVRRCLSTRQHLLENLVETVKQSAETLGVVENTRAGKLS